MASSDGQAFGIFYDRLKEIREYHRRFPSIDVTEVSTAGSIACMVYPRFDISFKHYWFNWQWHWAGMQPSLALEREFRLSRCPGRLRMGMTFHVHTTQYITYQLFSAYHAHCMSSSSQTAPIQGLVIL